MPAFASTSLLLFTALASPDGAHATASLPTAEAPQGFRLAKSAKTARTALAKAEGEVRKQLAALALADAVQTQARAVKQWAGTPGLSKIYKQKAERLLQGCQKLKASHPTAKTGDLKASQQFAKTVSDSKLIPRAPKELRAEAHRLLRKNDPKFAAAFDRAVPGKFALVLEGGSEADGVTLNQGLLEGAQKELQAWGVTKPGTAVINGKVKLSAVSQKGQSALLRRSAMTPFFLTVNANWADRTGKPLAKHEGEINFISLDRERALRDKAAGAQWMERWLNAQLAAADGVVDHPHLTKVGKNAEIEKMKGAMDRFRRRR